VTLRRAVSFAIAAGLLAGWTHTASADDMTIRGNYYRDRNTRVIQPVADFTKEYKTGTTVGGRYLLDAITSASVASGVSADSLFTELRQEFGVRLGQRLGPVNLGASYSYSSESDYWAHTATLGADVDLFQRNTNLSVALSYGHDDVAQRMPGNFSVLGQLDTVHLIVGWSQVLSRTAIMNVGYDFIVSGFGDKTNGFQSNPYRLVNVGGSMSREEVPFQRLRNAIAASLYYAIPLPSPTVPFLGFRAAYRYYVDDWGIQSHTPELRLFLPVGPVEFRTTGRIYVQDHQASFWSDLGDGLPAYTGNGGKPCTTCLSSSTKGGLYLTSDPKLSIFTSEFLELRVLLKLRFLRPLSAWLSEGLFEASYGHMINDRYPHRAFGDADIAGLTFTFPL